MRETKIKSPSGKDLLFIDGSGDDAASGLASTPLIILSFGEDFSGKSRFGATGPELIGCVPLDRKTRATFERTAKELGRKYLMPKQDLVREGNMAVRSALSDWYGRREDLTKDQERADTELARLSEESRKEYRSHVNMVKDIIWTLHDNKDVQCLLIDLFEQFYQDVKYAHYGRTGHIIKKIGKTDQKYKDSSEADQEIKDFIDSISDKHLILTHRSKAEYVKDVATGKNIWSGYKWLGHSCNVVVEHVKNKAWDPDSEDERRSWHYALSVVRSQDMKELEGPMGQLVLKDDKVNFESLQALIFPKWD